MSEIMLGVTAGVFYASTIFHKGPHSFMKANSRFFHKMDRKFKHNLRKITGHHRHKKDKDKDIVIDISKVTKEQWSEIREVLKTIHSFEDTKNILLTAKINNNEEKQAEATKEKEVVS